jgi:hypothetical protein
MVMVDSYFIGSTRRLFERHSGRVTRLVTYLVLASTTGACSAASADPYPGGIGGATDTSMGGAGTPQQQPTQGATGTSYTSMAPPMLDPLPRGPAGQWQYHEIDGALCRDGSAAGFYTRFSDTSQNLVIYLEQGGACFNSTLCAFNPASIDETMTGRTLTEAIGGLEKGVRQQPPSTGLFDATRPENPVGDWNMVWVPYCTGDAHGGSSPNASVPGVDTPQQMVGYMNMQRFIGHIVPTFQGAGQVLLTGTSAGSIGAGLSYNQVQDAFGATPVTLVMDSAVPFSDAYMAPCLQQTWRDLWNFEALLPPECTDCRNPDGGGLLNLVFFSAQKYPNARLGIISANEDDVMRFFYSFGLDDCHGGGSYPDGLYTEAVTDLRAQAVPYSAQFASYYVNGIHHMYEQFDDFYAPLSGGLSIAQWLGALLEGTAQSVGP